FPTRRSSDLTARAARCAFVVRLRAPRSAHERRSDRGARSTARNYSDRRRRAQQPALAGRLDRDDRSTPAIVLTALTQSEGGSGERVRVVSNADPRRRGAFRWTNDHTTPSSVLGPDPDRGHGALPPRLLGRHER